MPSAKSAFLQHAGYVGLPKHEGSGGFDHAASHAQTGHVYVAHTANSAVDVFDPASGKHLFSVPQLPGVAGVLVSDEAQLIIASNRAENTVAICRPLQPFSNAPFNGRFCANASGTILAISIYVANIINNIIMFL